MITKKLYKRQLLSIVIFILIQLLTLISPYIMGITRQTSLSLLILHMK